MKPIRWLTRGATLATMGMAGGALVVTARHLLATPQPLESALPGKGHIDRRREGDIYYNVAGPEGAEPVVLLHDFYPGASNYEFRRIYPRLATDYRVYAPDWLGFGLSERPALAYTGEFYARLLSGFLRDTIGRPAIVIADGLAANAAVRSASDDPDLFARLVLVAPHALADAVPGLTLGQAITRGAQRSSLGVMPYAIMATRTALRWRLGRRAARGGEGAATDDALDHASASAHQFGGHHAALALFTGELDLPILNAFALLEPPVLVVGGGEDRHHTPVELTDLARLNPYARLEIIASAGTAVGEDQPAAFVERVGDWLRTPLERHPAEVLMEADEDAPAAVETQEMGTLSALATRPAAHAPTGEVTTSADVAPSLPASSLMTGTLAPDPTLTSANPIERFGEPRGFVTSPPGLDALHGLAEQAPDTTPLEDVPASAPASAPAETPPGALAEAPDANLEASPETDLTETDLTETDLTETDEVRDALDTPEVPTPVTLPAMTAPLDTAAPLVDEGEITTATGPHPVPADARPAPPPAATPSAATPPPAATRAGAASNRALGTGRLAVGGRPRTAPAGSVPETPKRTSERGARVNRTEANRAGARDPDKHDPDKRGPEKHDPDAARGSSPTVPEGGHAPSQTNHKGGAQVPRHQSPAPGHGGHTGHGTPGRRHTPRKGKGPQR